MIWDLSNNKIWKIIEHCRFLIILQHCRLTSVADFAFISLQLRNFELMSLFNFEGKWFKIYLILKYENSNEHCRFLIILKHCRLINLVVKVLLYKVSGSGNVPRFQLRNFGLISLFIKDKWFEV